MTAEAGAAMAEAQLAGRVRAWCSVPRARPMRAGLPKARVRKRHGARRPINAARAVR